MQHPQREHTYIILPGTARTTPTERTFPHGGLRHSSSYFEASSSLDHIAAAPLWVENTIVKKGVRKIRSLHRNTGYLLIRRAIRRVLNTPQERVCDFISEGVLVVFVPAASTICVFGTRPGLRHGDACHDRAGYFIPRLGGNVSDRLLL